MSASNDWQARGAGDVYEEMQARGAGDECKEMQALSAGDAGEEIQALSAGDACEDMQARCADDCNASARCAKKITIHARQCDEPCMSILFSTNTSIVAQKFLRHLLQPLRTYVTNYLSIPYVFTYTCIHNV